MVRGGSPRWRCRHSRPGCARRGASAGAAQRRLRASSGAAWPWPYRHWGPAPPPAACSAPRRRAAARLLGRAHRRPSRSKPPSSCDLVPERAAPNIITECSLFRQNNSTRFPLSRYFQATVQLCARFPRVPWQEWNSTLEGRKSAPSGTLDATRHGTAAAAAKGGVGLALASLYCAGRVAAPWCSFQQ